MITPKNPGGCGRPLAPGQWWTFCGETDMGQTAPVLCTECGGDLKLAEQPERRAMTWGEFKAAVEAAGVKDGDEIGWIDISQKSSASDVEVARRGESVTIND